ncbi:MAG TPA: membrane protein insertase YidC [Gammaproteobacteria bacterium]|nr:membrane protein insertase YidC [Gammaproteobacteria bacterium]
MDNPRVLLAIALSFIVLMMWQAWMQDYGPATSAPPQAGAGSNPATDTPADMPDTSVPAEAGQTASLPAEPPVAGLDPAAGQAGSQKVEVLTDTYRALIDTRGGTLTEVDLLQYPATHEPDSPPFRLLEQSPQQMFIAQSGLRTGAREGEPNHRALFAADQTRYRLAEGQDALEVVLRWDDGQGLQINKIYRFQRASYVVEVRFEVINNGAVAWVARPYYQLQRTPLARKQKFLYTYTGAVIYSPEEKYEKIKFDDMEESRLDREIQGGWAAMLQHYFLAAIIPDPQDSARYYSRALPNQHYLIGFSDTVLQVAPGERRETGIRMFIGPKLQHMMADVAEGLELTVDYGKLTVLAQPIFWLLEKIHALIGNWGWSIIILTLLIKLMFFKLSETSYRSMANMRKLAPRLQALKERYGDDKQKLNQAMMEMYKKEKVNPLGGCLPVLVQIPVFIALYWVLLESVEMRQAPFMLWLQDLSSPDPYYILPLLMGITMLIQQKLNPAPMDPVQAKVMMILPIMFTVFFAFFPSGLVLYWVVNNTLSIAQQWVITRRVEQGQA